MSQNHASQTENLISLVRLSIGTSSPVFWDQTESSQTWTDRGVDVVLVEKPNVTPSSPFEINSERLKAIEESKTEWIWMVDADVVPTEKFYVSLEARLRNSKAPKFCGGLYESLSFQSVWERSYNRVCNLWSQAHQTPLGGNFILHRSLVPQIQDLKSRAFGAEEYFLKQIADEHGIKTEILPLKLPHLNGKSLQTLISTCKGQAVQEKPSIPRKNYFRLLLNSFGEAPLETTVAAVYFLMSAVLFSRFPKTKSH